MAGPITTTTAAEYIPELWSNEVIVAYEENAVLANLVDLSFKELAKAGHGDIINVPTFSALAVATVSQSTGVAQISPATDAVTTITVQTWEGARLTFPSIVTVQSMDSMRKTYTEGLGRAMALAIDDDLCALVASISQNVGTLAVDLTDVNLLAGEEYLDIANAPLDDRFIVIHPSQLMGFFQEEKYANSLYRGSSGNLDGSKGRGYIGPLYRSDVYESSQMVSNTSGHDNVMFQKKWAALVVQSGPTVEQWRNVAYAADEVTIHAIWGVREMRATSGVWMKGL